MLYPTPSLTCSCLPYPILPTYTILIYPTLPYLILSFMYHTPTVPLPYPYLLDSTMSHPVYETPRDKTNKVAVRPAKTRISVGGSYTLPFPGQWFVWLYWRERRARGRTCCFCCEYTVKNWENFEHPKNYCSCTKIWTKCFCHRTEGADRKGNRSSLIWIYALCSYMSLYLVLLKFG